MNSENPGPIKEIWHYLTMQKKWWLMPLILAFLVLAIIFGIAQTAPIVSPFIYTIF